MLKRYNNYVGILYSGDPLVM